MESIKKYYNYDTIARGLGFGGIEVKFIEYDIDDYIIFVAGAHTGLKSIHRCKIYYEGDYHFFKFRGRRIKFDDLYLVNSIWGG